MWKTSVTCWPGGVVPYELGVGVDWNASNRKNLMSAIAVWNRKLGGVVNLRERRSGDPNFLVFTWELSGACSSKVGMQGGRQVVDCPAQLLATGVSERTFIHEIGHALGLKHEHQRFDRDDWVVLAAGIAFGPGGQREGNFRKLGPPAYMISGPYDCQSVMHYPQLAFNGVPYFFARPNTPCASGALGGSTLSSMDITTVKVLYGSAPTLEPERSDKQLQEPPLRVE